MPLNDRFEKEEEKKVGFTFSKRNGGATAETNSAAPLPRVGLSLPNQTAGVNFAAPSDTYSTPGTEDNYYGLNIDTNSPFAPWVTDVMDQDIARRDANLDARFAGLSDPASGMYNPYISATNVHLQELSALTGVDLTGGISHDELEQMYNRFAADTSLKRTVGSATNPPGFSSPGTSFTKKSATQEEKNRFLYERTAYLVGELWQNETNTRQAEKELAGLQKEIQYWVDRKDLNLSDEQIYKNINWGNYKKLAEMEANRKGGAASILNRSVNYTDDLFPGMIWAARNGSNADPYTNAIFNAAGIGNRWTANPETAKYTDITSEDYDPYMVTGTMHNMFMKYGVTSIDEKTKNDLKAKLYGAQGEKGKDWERISNAYDFTQACLAEKKNVESWIDYMIDQGASYEEIERDLYKAHEFVDGSDNTVKTSAVTSLDDLDKSLRTGVLKDTTEKIGWSRKETLDRVRERIAERDAPEGFTESFEEAFGVDRSYYTDPEGMLNPAATDAMKKFRQVVLQYGTEEDRDLVKLLKDLDTPDEKTAFIENFVTSGAITQEDAFFLNCRVTEDYVADSYMAPMWQINQYDAAVKQHDDNLAILHANGYEGEDTKAMQEKISNAKAAVETLGLMNETAQRLGYTGELSDISGVIEFLEDQPDYFSADLVANQAGWPTFDDYKEFLLGSLDEIGKLQADEKYGDRIISAIDAVNRANEDTEKYGEGLDEARATVADINQAIDDLISYGVSVFGDYTIDENGLTNRAGHMTTWSRERAIYMKRLGDAMLQFDQPVQNNAAQNAANFSMALASGDETVRAEAETGRAQTLKSIETNLKNCESYMRLMEAYGIQLTDSEGNNLPCYQNFLDYQQNLKDNQLYLQMSLLPTQDKDFLKIANDAREDTKNNGWSVYDIYDDYDPSKSDIDYMRPLWKSTSADEPDGKYGYYLTKREEDVYYYLLGKGQREEAERYLNFINGAGGVGRIRDIAKTQQEAKEFADSSPFLAYMGAIAVNPFSAVGSLYTLKQRLTGQEIDTYSPAFLPTVYVGSIRTETGNIFENFAQSLGLPEGWGRFIHDMSTSGFDSMVNSAIMGPVFGKFTEGGKTAIGAVLHKVSGTLMSTLPMGMQAMSGAVWNAKINGADDDQAMAFGLATLAAETLTEAITFDNITGAFRSGAGALPDETFRKTFAEAISAALKDAPEEAAGEVIAEVAEILSGNAILGIHSEYAMAVDEYMTKYGLTRDKAEEMATRDCVHDVLLAGLSGGLMGLGTTSVSYLTGSFSTKIGQLQSGLSGYEYTNIRLMNEKAAIDDNIANIQEAVEKAQQKYDASNGKRGKNELAFQQTQLKNAKDQKAEWEYRNTHSIEDFLKLTGLNLEQNQAAVNAPSEQADTPAEEPKPRHEDVFEEPTETPETETLAPPAPPSVEEGQAAVDLQSAVEEFVQKIHELNEAQEAGDPDAVANGPTVAREVREKLNAALAAYTAATERQAEENGGTPSPEALQKIEWVDRLKQMSEGIENFIASGVVPEPARQPLPPTRPEPNNIIRGMPLAEQAAELEQAQDEFNEQQQAVLELERREAGKEELDAALALLDQKKANVDRLQFSYVEAQRAAQAEEQAPQNEQAAAPQTALDTAMGKLEEAAQADSEVTLTAEEAQAYYESQAAAEETQAAAEEDQQAQEARRLELRLNRYQEEYARAVEESERQSASAKERKEAWKRAGVLKRQVQRTQAALNQAVEEQNAQAAKRGEQEKAAIANRAALEEAMQKLQDLSNKQEVHLTAEQAQALIEQARANQPASEPQPPERPQSPDIIRGMPAGESAGQSTAPAGNMQETLGSLIDGFEQTAGELFGQLQDVLATAAEQQQAREREQTEIALRESVMNAYKTLTDSLQEAKDRYSEWKEAQAQAAKKKKDEAAAAFAEQARDAFSDVYNTIWDDLLPRFKQAQAYLENYLTTGETSTEQTAETTEETAPVSEETAPAQEETVPAAETPAEQATPTVAPAQADPAVMSLVALSKAAQSNDQTTQLAVATGVLTNRQTTEGVVDNEAGLWAGAAANKMIKTFGSTKTMTGLKHALANAYARGLDMRTFRSAMTTLALSGNNGLSTLRSLFNGQMDIGAAMQQAATISANPQTSAAVDAAVTRYAEALERRRLAAANQNDMVTGAETNLENADAELSSARTALDEKRLDRDHRNSELQDALSEYDRALELPGQTEEQAKTKRQALEAASRAVDTATEKLGNAISVVREYEERYNNASRARATAKQSYDNARQGAYQQVSAQAAQNVAAARAQNAQNITAQMEARRAAAEQQTREAETNARAVLEEKENRRGRSNANRTTAERIADRFPDATPEERERVIRMAQEKLDQRDADKVADRKRFIQNLKRKFGINIVILDTTKGGTQKRVNGYFDRVHNRIVLDEATTTSDLLLLTGLHEVTHTIEGTEYYDRYADLVLGLKYGPNWKNSSQYKAEIQGKINQYNAWFAAERAAGHDPGSENLDEIGARKELVADATGRILFTDANGQVDMDLLNTLVTEEPSIAKKIFSAIGNFLRKLGRIDDPSVYRMEKARELLAKALRANETEQSQDLGSEYGDAVAYSVPVTDPETLDFLENQEHITVYRSMQYIDGKLYPPMAAVVGGEMSGASELGQWEQATESPEAIKRIDKNGVGHLIIGKGAGQGTTDVSYNPYIHTSNSVFNDQFSGAYNRPNLVTVEVEVPVSEADSAYKAQYAKDGTGWVDWHSGSVSAQLKAQTGFGRRVFLSRYCKPVRVLSNAEVAAKYKEMLQGTNIEVADNVVSPGLLEELKKIGVPIKESGKIKNKSQYSLPDEAIETVSQREGRNADLVERVSTEAKDSDGDQLYSLTSMSHDFPIYEQMMRDSGMFSNDEITQLFNTISLAMDTIEADAGILDLNERGGKEDRAFSPVKPNSDPLYKVSLDFSTLCRKRLLQQTIQEAIEKKFNVVMSKAERVALTNALKQVQKEGKKIEVACALCYVESARLKSPEQIRRFMNDKRGFIIDYLSKNDRDYKAAIQQAADAKAAELGYSEGYSLKEMPKKDADAIRAVKRRMYAEYTPTAEQEAMIREAETMDESMYKTAEGLAELKKNYPMVFDAYTTMVRNATKSKGLESDVPFYARDTYDTISDALIAAMNAENGLRSQSWSDFQVTHLLDYIGAIIELSTRNAKMQAYTKVPEYARLMGRTGQMINLSYIPTDYDGEHLGFDSKEGMDFETGQKLRNEFPDTVGNICIGIRDDHIRALLAAVDENGIDLIDYVIPYHKSSMDKATRDRIGLKNWSEYESQQTEKNHDYDTTVHDENYHKHPNFSEWFSYPEAKALADQYKNQGMSAFEASKAAMEDMARKYIDLCHSRGLQEKFANFSGETGYWKLLIDRKMINQVTGELIEQKAVRPNFDSDVIQDILHSEVDRVRETQPDMDSAVDEMLRLWENGAIQKAAKSKDVQSAIKVMEENFAKAYILASSEDQNVQYSLPSDEDYEIAVASGDMEAAQRMVDEAARAAGYDPNYLFWRGDSAPYTELEPGDGGNLGRGLYFTENRPYAERFARGGVLRQFYLRRTRGGDISNDMFEDFRMYTDQWCEDNGIDPDYIEPETLSEIFDDFIADNDFDYIEGENVGGLSYGAPETAVQNSWQAKLADPVTYDDAGEMIPLSQRFNDQSDDIRYSLPSDDILNDLIDRYIDEELANIDNDDFAPEATPIRADRNKPAANPSGTSSGPVQSGDTIMQNWAKALGIPADTRRRKYERSVYKTTRGYTRRGSGIIHVKDAGNVETAAHEMGHVFDEMFGLLSHANTTDMISKMSQDPQWAVWINQYAPEDRPAEAVAEVMKNWIIDRNVAINIAGQDFINYLEKCLADRGWLKPTLEAAEQLRKNRAADADELAMASVQLEDNKKKPLFPNGWRSAAAELHDYTFDVDNLSQAYKQSGKFSEAFDTRTLLQAREGKIQKYTDSVLGTGDGKGTLVDPEGNIVLKADGTKWGSLHDILSKIGEENEHAFNAYLLLMHARDRQHSDIKLLSQMSQAEITALSQDEIEQLRQEEAQIKKVFSDEVDVESGIANMERKHPEFKAIAQELYDFYDAFMRTWLVNTNPRFAAEYEAMHKRYPHYVPTFRAGMDANRQTGARPGQTGTNGVRRAYGGTTDIYNPIMGLAEYIQRYIASYEQIEVLRSLDKVFSDPVIKTTGVAEIAQDDVTLNYNGTTVANAVKNLQDAIEGLRQEGTSLPDTAIERLLEAVAETDAKQWVLKDPKGNDVINVPLADGTTRSWTVYDPSIIKAITFMPNTSAASFAQRIVRSLTSFLSTMSTAKSLSFGAFNFMSDSGEALNTGHSSYTWVDYMAHLSKSFWELGKNKFNDFTGNEVDETYRLYKLFGEMGSRYAFRAKDTQKVIRQKLYNNSTTTAQKIGDILYGGKNTTVGEKVKNLMTAPIRTIESAGEFLEELTRFNEFRMASEKGLADLSTYEGRLRAGRYGREVTVDFSKRGYNDAIAAARTYIPFLNASIQGTAKALELFSKENEGNRVKIAARIVINSMLVNAVTAFIRGMTWDDDDKEAYDQLSDYEQNKYFHIKAGDQYIRIKRSQNPLVQLGAAFGNLIGSTMTGFEDNPLGDFAGVCREIAVNMIIDPTQTVFAPFRDASFNTTYWGGPIENSTMQEMDIANRYDPGDKGNRLYRMIGALIGVSPAKVDYVFGQYTGSLGAVGSKWMSAVFENAQEGKRVDEVVLGSLVDSVRDRLAERFTIDPVNTNRINASYKEMLTKLTEIGKAADEGMTPAQLRGNLTEAEQRKAISTAKEMMKSGGKVGRIQKEISGLWKKYFAAKENKNYTDERKEQEMREIRKQLNEKMLKANEIIGDYFLEYGHVSPIQYTWNNIVNAAMGKD